MKRLFCFFLLFASATPAAAQMTCAEPSKQFTTEVEGDIKATAEGMKRIFEAQGAAQVRTKVVELIQKLPDANRTLLQRDLISATCELIKNSQAVDFDKKASLLINLTKEIQAAFAKPSATLNPVGENIIVATSLPTTAVDYALVMVSEASVYKRCDVRGGSVSAGERVEFQQIYAYARDELAISPIDAHNPSVAMGNFLLKIPKRMLFAPVDSARDGLVYFNSISSGNCYDNDIDIYLAIWQRQTNEYLSIFRIRSATSHGLCRVFISNAEVSEFLNYYKRAQEVLQTREQALARNFDFAAKSDAFKNVEKAKAAELVRAPLPSNVQPMTVTFAMDKIKTRKTPEQTPRPRI